MMYLKKNHDAEIYNKDYQILKAEAAMSMIAGTARSMGITVEE